MSVPSINPNIFRQYDIRGLVGKDLTPQVVEAIGKAFGSRLRMKSGRPGIAVGYDVRESSEEFAEAFSRGLSSAGADAIQIGLVPTPVLYFSLFHWDLDGGVMVTGSHNPVTYNGLKLCEGKWPIHGQEILELREEVLRETSAAGEGLSEIGKGKVERRDALTPYKAQLAARFPRLGSGRIVVDAGNGTAGTFFPGLLRELGFTVDELYCEPDGSFPNHLPDPEVPENVRDLIRKVEEVNADLGFAFDGDSDRVGLIAEDGERIPSDRLLLLFAKHYLSRYPGGKVIYDVKCSEILDPEIRSAGGIPILWKTGHSLIKKKMREEGALLAGELSGHICIYADYYGFDDAFFAALLALEIRRSSGRPLRSLLGEFPRTCSTHEIKIDCPDELKFELVEDLRRRARAGGDQVIDIDGARIVNSDGWFLVRASNTTPVLTVRLESRSPEGLERIARKADGALSAFPILDLAELRRISHEAGIAKPYGEGGALGSLPEEPWDRKGKRDSSNR